MACALVLQALLWHVPASTLGYAWAEEGDRQSVRAAVNPGGPEDWPEDKGLSTVIGAGTPAAQRAADGNGGAPDAVSGRPAAPASQEPQEVAQPSAAPSQPAAQAPGAPAPPVSPPAAPAPASAGAAAPAVPPPPAEPQPRRKAVSGAVSGTVLGSGPEAQPTAAPKEERPVIYVDSHGNPVAKPVDPGSRLEEAVKLLGEQKIEEALIILNELKAMPGLGTELRERVLYGISDCYWAQYGDDPVAGYEPIVAATSEAMHANIRSDRVPDALLRLGLVNIGAGNLVDARGYVVALLRRYPDYPGVAQGLTALAEALSKKGDFAQAENFYSIVLDRFPDSSELLKASVGLANALVAQRKHDRAHIIFEFITKRWPRHYIDDPQFLLMHAANEEVLGGKAAALSLYWLYYNLLPAQEGNGALLFKMADMYLEMGNMAAAEFLFQRVRRDYAGSREAAMSGLRLAERGIYGSPLDYARLCRLFASRPGAVLPQEYARLTEYSKTEPEAVLARLKMAMWLCWSRRYVEAMGKAAEFIDAYPENPNVPQAKDLIWEAFQKELANSMAEKNYGRILILWNGFPLVRERYGKMDPDMRYVLAQGLLERGEQNAALSLLSEFLGPTMHPRYGEAAFTEFFNRYLKQGAWANILDLGKTVESWPLSPQVRDQLDYALALSAQNLELRGPALAMWRKLAENQNIPLYQRAYATFFLARDAEERKDIRNAYALNRKVIDLFTQLQEERSDKADPQRIKDAMVALMDICEVGNRVPEALQWVRRYAALLQDGAPEIPGLLFREARLYRKLGDTTRAKALLEEVTGKYPDSPFAQAASGELRTFEVSRDLQSYMPGSSGGQGGAAPAGGQAGGRGAGRQ